MARLPLAGRKRNRVLATRFSTDELEQLRELASRAGARSVGAYVRDVVLRAQADPPRETIEQALARVERLVIAMQEKEAAARGKV